MLIQTVIQVSATAMAICGQSSSSGMKSAAKMPAKRMKTEGCQSATLIHHSHAVRPPQRAPKARRTQA